MIQIICGVYGGADGMKRPGDKPFSLSPAEEARLVARKVAVYVGVPAGESTQDEDTQDEDTQDDTTNDGTPIGFGEMPPLPEGVTAIPEYSVDMKMDQLREIGKLCGLTFKVGMSKQEMVDALDKHIEEHMVEDEDATVAPDDVPTFDPTGAVE